MTPCSFVNIVAVLTMKQPVSPLAWQLAWWQIGALAGAGFVFTTSEFSPVGLLTDIASSFSMPIANTGLILTVYAWIVALASLPFMLISGDIERKKLLIGVFCLFICGQIIAATAWSFPVLLVARVCVALAHAVFWSITGAIVIRLAPSGQKSKALSVLVSGNMLATILGLPLGRLIGQAVGWRSTFGIIAVLAAILLITLIRLLPRLPSQNTGSWRSLPILVCRPRLICLYLLVLIMISAHFTVYSYIEPYIIHVAGFSNQFATWILFVFGTAGFCSSQLFSKVHHRAPKSALYGAITLLVICMSMLQLATRSHASTILVCFVWGMRLIMMNLSVQMQVFDLAADATDIAMAMYSGIYNLGIGAGALFGNQTSLHLGMAWTGTVGGIWCLTFHIYFRHRLPRNLL